MPLLPARNSSLGKSGQLRSEIEMIRILKTIGVALLGTFAVPLAGMSGIGVLIGLLCWWSDKGISIMLMLGCGAVFVACCRFLLELSRQATALVAKINQQTGLNFNPANILGHPSPAFLIFDSQNQKLAMCNSSTGDYCVYELSILLRWHYEWRNVDEWDVSGTSSTVPGTVLRIPNLERTQRRHRFTLVLELADENCPLMVFPMMSEQRASLWCAKLNAIVNG